LLLLLLLLLLLGAHATTIEQNCTRRYNGANEEQHSTGLVAGQPLNLLLLGIVLKLEPLTKRQRFS
jgi:hypothetical protein